MRFFACAKNKRKKKSVFSVFSSLCIVFNFSWCLILLLFRCFFIRFRFFIIGVQKWVRVFCDLVWNWEWNLNLVTGVVLTWWEKVTVYYISRVFYFARFYLGLLIGFFIWVFVFGFEVWGLRFDRLLGHVLKEVWWHFGKWANRFR